MRLETQFIPNTFFYENKMDSAVLVGECISNPKLKVFTWFDTIVCIGKSIETETEFDSLSNHNTLILNQKPKVETWGVKWKIQKTFIQMDDKKTGDRLLMEHTTDSIGNFKGSIMIENEQFVAELIPKSDETIEITPMQ